MPVNSSKVLHLATIGYVSDSGTLTLLGRFESLILLTLGTFPPLMIECAPVNEQNELFSIIKGMEYKKKFLSFIKNSCLRIY